MAAHRTDVILVFGEAGGESEMPVHSLVLCLASPVFDAMLSSEMAERESRRIRVDASTREEFAEFYRFLLPLRGRGMVLSERNVDGMLTLSDYYQVDPLKEECAAVLESLPVTVPRLLQAHRHGLRRQYERCADALAQTFHEHDISALNKHSEVTVDVIVRAQTHFHRMHEKLLQIYALRPEVQRARDSLRARAWHGNSPLAPHDAEDPWARGCDPWAGPWAQPGQHPLDTLIRLMCESTDGARGS